jgi:Uncharacterized protein conserved in bacteria
MADTTKKDTKQKASGASVRRRGRLFGLAQFWRDHRNHTWQFPGQQPDENVLLVVRKHWCFLIIPAWPLLLSALLFVSAIVCSLIFTEPLFISVGSIVITLVAVLASGSWFAYSRWIQWWYETYIITNKRIINARGLLEPTRQATPIEKVQQVGTGIDTLLGLLFNFGTIHVYLTGGDFFIRDVPHPREVRDAIQGITERLKSKPAPAAVPKPKDPDLAAVLDALGKGKEVPRLPNADVNLPPLRNENGFLGPRRTFGGIFRVPCNVRYVSGEYTVKYIQRSNLALYRKLAIPGLLLVLLAPITLLAPGTGIVPYAIWSFWWPIMGFIVVALLISMFLTYSNHVDDVFILTNRRIIDIERHFVFFFETRLETEYKNVRDVRVKVPNVIARFFDVGDVYVETPGNNPDLVLSYVDQPFILQDEILGIKSHKDKEDAAQKENQDKKNLHTWFSTVVAKLEETARGRGTPDLRSMDLLSAMACAQELGLDVTVRGEAIDDPHMPPGHVLSQNPPPGTMMEAGSSIEIILSKRPMPSIVNTSTQPF